MSTLVVVALNTLYRMNKKLQNCVEGFVQGSYTYHWWGGGGGGGMRVPGYLDIFRGVIFDLFGI